MKQRQFNQHHRTGASIDLWRICRHVSLVACLWMGLPEFPALAEAGAGEVVVSECGYPLAPRVKTLGRAGADLWITVQFPPTDAFPQGLWVRQRDSAGELVGEVWVESGGEFEISATIPDGLRAALDRGPNFTLEILDGQRQPIAEGTSLIIQLDCQDAMTCRLEPVLGISAEDARHVTTQLLSVMQSRMESGQSISIEDFSTQHPHLVGPLLNLFWQSSFQPPPPEPCHCRWIFATDETYLTGGAHLVWTNGIAPEAPKDRYPGSAELHSWLVCTSTLPSPPLHNFMVDAGAVSEVWTASRWGSTCDAPCEPRITQRLYFPSRATVTGSPLGPVPPHHRLVENEVLWWAGSQPGDASLVAATSSEVTLSAPDVTHHLQPSTVHSGLSSYARFEGSTRIDLQLDWRLQALFASLLTMKVRSETCDGVPAFEAGRVIQPSFDRGNVILGPRPCDEEHHTSLVIKTGGG